MKKFFVAALLVTLPTAAAAAGAPYLTSGSSVLVASSSPANIYAAGGTVTVTSPSNGDLTALGGSVVVDASVAGDALLTGGSVHVAAPIAGDARITAGRVVIDESVGGDLVALGGSVMNAGGGGKNNFVVGGEVTYANGAEGSVTIYASAVSLGGTFNGDVKIVSAGRITLLPKTVIHGGLYYQAPEQASIPQTVKIDDGVHYTGASYLPTTEEARAIAFASFGVFLFVKILGGLILAGLFAGLFPVLAHRVIERTETSTPRRILLSLLLGFGVFVASPVLCILLSLTFVGIGLAALLALAYLLLIPISFIYAAIVLGSTLMRYLFKRSQMRFSDGVVGMLVLFLVWSIPIFGSLVVSLLVLYMMGILMNLLYRFAFPRNTLFDAAEA